MKNKTASKSKSSKRKPTRNESWLGMNWIRQEKRLAIYLRDGCACAYCGASVEQGTQLSLDHIVPHAKGGGNGEGNLVTCCSRCNSSRGKRSLPAFARAVARYVNHGIKAEDIIAHVRKCSRRSLKSAKVEAKRLITRRGSAAKVLASLCN